ncbi:CRISPR-associated endonuclease Cas3'' [Streptomyces sp. 184]|uniref:CRISPR-associated endonuclease Cas3'' n=1 Tax=Streptomyces sp. 184 TaxID=1827526 RepID=UPI003891BE3A
MPDNAGRAQGSFDPGAAVDTLLAKTPSHGHGSASLLTTHSLDTAAVAEVLWRLLAPLFLRREFDAAAGEEGRGIVLFRWICAHHDFGKATPGYQARFPGDTQKVLQVGLEYDRRFADEDLGYRHERAGAYLLRALLKDAGWPGEQAAWVWPLVAGHHGDIPPASALVPARARHRLLGGERWHMVRAVLLERVSAEVGFADWRECPPVRVPGRTAQLAACGLLKLADWLSSGLPGIDDPSEVSYEKSRERAQKACAEIAPVPGWTAGLPEPDDAALRRRPTAPRPGEGVAGAAVDAARGMPGGGLLVVESADDVLEAGLAAAEIMAARSGVLGLFVGVPEWSSHHDVFRRVRAWLAALDPVYPERAVLLHQLRALEPELSAARYPDSALAEILVAECPGETAAPAGQFAEETAHTLPTDWFHGHAKGLLAPFVVAPTYQALAAFVRTNLVMVRTAGLLGKVLVLDIADFLDARTRVHLLEALRWLGRARVPVVLLAAALPDGVRARLLDAWLGGALEDENHRQPAVEAQVHPRVTAAWVADDGPRDGPRVETRVQAHAEARVEARVEARAVPGGAGRRVRVRTLPDGPCAEGRTARQVADLLAPGRTALVVRSSAARAQALLPRLRAALGPDDTVVLLHTQLAAGPQAVRARAVLARLGPGAPPPARGRYVVIADPLVERAFPVRVDLLVSDMAPLVSLLGRLGTLRPAGSGLQVTGYAPGDPAGEECPPVFPEESVRLYGAEELTAAAALVEQAAAGPGWHLPGDTAALVAAVHGPVEGFPARWRPWVARARREGRLREESAEARAAQHALTRRGEHGSATLAGLSYLATAHKEPDLPALVRGDGFPVETLALVRDAHGYRSLLGPRLGPEGTVKGLPDAAVEAVRCGNVRLPATCREAGEQEVKPLPEWRIPYKEGGDQRLRTSRALVLDEELRVRVGGRLLRYDDELGLVDEGPVP